jgi:RNA polymerase sigma-70 factor (ECF subfamily)
MEQNLGTFPTTHNTPQSDVELFLALQAGQTHALSVIYERYSKLVFSIALHHLKNHQETEDLTQEIFLSLCQDSKYDPKRGSLMRFLTILTRSRSLDRLRSRSSRVRLLSRWRLHAESQSSTPSPVEQISLDECVQRAIAALQDLVPEQRQVLELAYYQGFSQSEIAQHLTAPLGTVKYRARQGLAKLKTALGDCAD